MYEQDYIMRLIKEMVRAILKLVFNIDTDSPTKELLEESEEQNTLEVLLDMIDGGKINEAENRVYEMTSAGEKKALKIALLFYAYLNGKDDEFLEVHNFSREEVKQGLEALADRYGVSGRSDIFMGDM